MLTTEELYTASIIDTKAEWDAVSEALCGIINPANLFTVLNRIAEAALRLPADSYAFNRLLGVYNKIDSIARRKTELGVF